MKTRGNLIVFEGPDGVGKTTLAKALTTSFQQAGNDCLYYAFPGRMEGTLGHLVYQLHHRPAELGVAEISPASLQMLHVAAHIDAIDRVILPTLDSGSHVILDRFWWSTWVYGIADDLDTHLLNAMLAVEAARWQGQCPHTAFLIARAEPLRWEHERGTWDKLCQLYERVSREQKHTHPVYRIMNEGTVDEALTSIKDYLVVNRQEA